eukprot:10270189-Ditylum_brightwellii.AAC.1
MVISSVWFKWSTACDRIRAWRAVGITASGMRPDLLDRTTFRLHEQPQICTDEPQTPRPQHQYNTRGKVEQIFVGTEEKEQYFGTPSPIDTRRRSPQYLLRQGLAWQRAHQTRPLVPLSEMNACRVPSAEIQVRKHPRIKLYTDGSATMNGLATQARNAENEQGQKKEAAEKKRRDRKAKKEEKDRAQAELIA